MESGDLGESNCISRRRQWHPTSVLLPGKSHGWRSLVGCSPWGHYKLDMTERLHFHFSLSCIEGNGNPLQCSCLQNPRDGRAWWAAGYGVAQSRTRLKRLSSSSSSQPEKSEVGPCWAPPVLHQEPPWQRWQEGPGLTFRTGVGGNTCFLLGAV